MKHELVLSLLAVAGITVIYLIVVLIVGIPAASGLFGHSIGVVGFIMMLATETLYSLRKRARWIRWGRLSVWLKLHIFTGIVGPYLVFLHSAWKFQGLAGLTMWLTAVVVLSGFIGRYIYTSIPRTAEGTVLEEGEIRQRIAVAEKELAARLSAQGGDSTRFNPVQETAWAPGNLLAAAWPLRAVAARLAVRRIGPEGLVKLEEIARLRQQKRRLERQIASLATTRRLLALWHAFHIPLGVVMFVMAFIHMGAALYYGTLLR